MCFLVYAAKFSGTPFSKNICVQLLLQFRSILEWKYDFDGKIWIALLSSRILTKKASFRSSRLEVFSKKGVLSNFAKFTGKHLCQSLFYNTLLIKRLWHRWFPVNFAIFLRTPFLPEHSGGLLGEFMRYNHGEIICRLFDILLQFPFTTIERELNYSH